MGLTRSEVRRRVDPPKKVIENQYVATSVTASSKIPAAAPRSAPAPARPTHGGFRGSIVVPEWHSRASADANERQRPHSSAKLATHEITVWAGPDAPNPPYSRPTEEWPSGRPAYRRVGPLWVSRSGSGLRRRIPSPPPSAHADVGLPPLRGAGRARWVPLVEIARGSMLAGGDRCQRGYRWATRSWLRWRKRRRLRRHDADRCTRVAHLDFEALTSRW